MTLGFGEGLNINVVSSLRHISNSEKPAARLGVITKNKKTHTSETKCKLRHKKTSFYSGHPSDDTLHLPPDSNCTARFSPNTPLRAGLCVRAVSLWSRRLIKVSSALSQDISWLEMKHLALPHLLYWLQTALWLFLWLKWHWSAWWQTQWNRHCSSPAIRKPSVTQSMF